MTTKPTGFTCKDCSHDITDCMCVTFSSADITYVKEKNLKRLKDAIGHLKSFNCYYGIHPTQRDKVESVIKTLEKILNSYDH